MEQGPRAASRVLIAVTDTRRGGAPIKLATLARAASKRDWEVCFVSLMPKGAVLRDLEEGGIRGIDLEMRGRRDVPRALVQLRRTIARFRPRVIQSSLWHANFLCRLAAAGTGIPVVNGHEGGDVDKPRWQVVLDRATRSLASRHVAVSRAVADRVAARDGLPRQHIEIIPAGKRISEWSPGQDRATARGRIGLPPDATVVGWTGRMDPVKNLPVLVHALARLPGWWLVLGGDGAERASLERLARDLRVQDRIVLTGELADVRTVLEAIDVFCLPSREEGMPASLLEAMAMALPVVAARVGGIPEAVTDGENGLLVAPGDPDELARALRGAAGDPKMGRRARDTVARNFSEDAMVQAFLTLWRTETDGYGSHP